MGPNSWEPSNDAPLSWWVDGIVGQTNPLHDPPLHVGHGSSHWLWHWVLHRIDAMVTKEACGQLIVQTTALYNGQDLLGGLAPSTGLCPQYNRCHPAPIFGKSKHQASIILYCSGSYWCWDLISLLSRSIAIGIASPLFLFEPPTSKLSYHPIIDQKTSVCTQKSSASPGKFYKNAFLSHWYTILYCWAVILVCNLRHLSFVAWWIWDVSFLCRGSLLWIFSSALIIQKCNRQWQFISASKMLRDCLFCTDLLTMSTLFDPYLVEAHSNTKSSGKGNIIGPYLVEVHSDTKSINEVHIIWPHMAEVRSETKSSNKGHIIGQHLVKVCSKTKSSNKGHTIGPCLVKVCCLTKSSDEGYYFFATFSQSPLCDKSSDEGTILFGSHLVKVRCVTKSSNEGQIFFLGHDLVDVSCLISITHHSTFTLWIPLAWASQPIPPTRLLFPRGPISWELPTKFSSLTISWINWLGASKPIPFPPSGPWTRDPYAPNTFMPLRSISTFLATPLLSLETLPTKRASSAWSR